MWNERYSAMGAFDGVLFDPTGGLLTGGAMAATAAGGGLSAMGTLAGGQYAKQAGQMQQEAAEFTAEQLEENATQAVASSQRTALDTALKTSLAISSSRANAAGNGVNAGAGSAVTNVGNLAQRGSYQAMMDLFNGQSTATGLQNQAAGVRYTGAMEEIGGEEAQTASDLAAAGTLAGSAGNMAKLYGAMGNQSSRGAPGATIS
jgi:hypothetical protein